MRKNANAPSFGHGSPEHGGDPGLTKREYFAGLAMQGLLADPITNQVEREEFGEIAVAYADALLAALAVETKE